MKKVILIGFLLLFSVSSIYGQRARVNSAYNILRMAPPDIEAARTNLEAVQLDDPEIQNWARTWFTFGLLNERLFAREQAEEIRGTADPIRRGESVVRAFDYFMRAYQLDQLPNERGRVRPTYTRTIANYMRHYPIEIINFGIILFEQGDHSQAVDVWQRYLEMPDISFLAAHVTRDETYNAVKFNTALAAMMANRNDVAIMHLESVKDVFQVEDSYRHLSRLYLLEGDTVNYLRVLRTGNERHPNNAFILTSLIDYYININPDVELAMRYVSNAIANNPNEADFYFIRGVIYDAKEEFELALQDYRRAVELDENHHRALSSIGYYHYRRGVNQIEYSNTMRNVTQAQAERNRALEHFHRAIPYMVRARELAPADLNNLRALRIIYYRVFGERHEYFIEIDRDIISRQARQ